jgi:8-oxo-dGTP pyrophosphatase MutT (NUDIX family)
MADDAAPDRDPGCRADQHHDQRDDPRRAELAEAALRVLAREGGRGLTHSAVDAEAGVPDGTAAGCFPGRTALVGAVAEWVAALLPTEPPITRPRAVAYVVRDGDVLVFNHRPTVRTHGAGLQVPGGTVHDGEDPTAAVVREVREETGLDVEVVRHLGTITRGGRDLHHFHVAPLGPTPAAWDHDEKSDGDVALWTFSLFWLPIAVARHALDHGMGDLLDRL